MKINIDVPLTMKGIVTIEAHTPGGELLHREVKDNVIVDDGFSALGDTMLGDELLNTCILGKDNTPAAAGDGFLSGGNHGFINGITDVNCSDGCPIIQDRSISAVSTNNGGTSDVYAYTGDPDYFWSLTRKRIFTYSTDYFKAAQAGFFTDSCIRGEQATGDWLDDGWGNLAVEASYIAEIGFCSETPSVEKIFGECWLPKPGHYPEYWWVRNDQIFWSPSEGSLWNRVVLDQSIGFASEFAWDTPDVELALDAVITVTIELRVYFDTTARHNCEYAGDGHQRGVHHGPNSGEEV
jgi:hypothetical protein